MRKQMKHKTSSASHSYFCISAHKKHVSVCLKITSTHFNAFNDVSASILNLVQPSRSESKQKSLGNNKTEYKRMLRHFATCQMRPEIKDQGRDNVLLAQGYPTPQRAAMQRWWNRDK
jgi:hypothetical protein